ncbi:MAG: DMT family transporter [Alphaproteobacteria bacterium]
MTIGARDPHFLKGAFFIASAGVLASLSGVFFRQVEHASDWQIIFWRSGTMALCLLALVAVLNRGRVVAAFRAAGLPGLVAGLLLGASNVTYSLSIIHTTVANTLFIQGVSPFLAALLAWLVLKERVTRATLVAMVVALMGVGVMVGEGLGAGHLYGNAMALLSAAVNAAFVVALRFGRGADMLPSVAIAGFTGALAAFLVQGGDVAVSPHDALMGIIMGAVPMSMSLRLLTLGARYVPAAPATLIQLSETVCGPVWVLLAYGEKPALLTLLGGVFVLSAIAGLALWSMRRGTVTGTA